MKSRTVELRLRVKYAYSDDSEVPSEESCKDSLKTLVEWAASRGRLSAYEHLCVDDYRFTVETVATTDEHHPHKIQDEYPDGVCPDCGENIPNDVCYGESCDFCGHVWNPPSPVDD